MYISSRQRTKEFEHGVVEIEIELELRISSSKTTPSSCVLRMVEEEVLFNRKRHQGAAFNEPIWYVRCNREWRRLKLVRFGEINDDSEGGRLVVGNV